MVARSCAKQLGHRLAPGRAGRLRGGSVRTGSGAARIGVQPGDLLLAINGRPLRGAAALRRSVVDRSGELAGADRGADGAMVAIT